MKTYDAQKPAPYGLYYATNPIDVRFVGTEGEALDGPAKTYKRLPMLAVAVAGPILGGVFVFAFPAIVLLGVLGAVVKMAVSKLGRTADEAAQVATLRWAPGASYLNKVEGADKPAEQRDEALADLDKEVQARRDDENQA